jgi:hypothetical protein
VKFQLFWNYISFIYYVILNILDLIEAKGKLPFSESSIRGGGGGLISSLQEYSISSTWQGYFCLCWWPSNLFLHKRAFVCYQLHMLSYVWVWINNCLLDMTAKCHWSRHFALSLFSLLQKENTYALIALKSEAEYSSHIAISYFCIPSEIRSRIFVSYRNTLLLYSFLNPVYFLQYISATLIHCKFFTLLVRNLVLSRTRITGILHLFSQIQYVALYALKCRHITLNTLAIIDSSFQDKKED